MSIEDPGLGIVKDLEQKKGPTMAQVVEGEISEYGKGINEYRSEETRLSEKEILGKYLNNFWRILPCRNALNVRQRIALIEVENADTPGKKEYAKSRLEQMMSTVFKSTPIEVRVRLIEGEGKDASDQEKIIKEEVEEKGFSRKRLLMTGNEFSQDVMIALEQTGLDKEEFFDFAEEFLVTRKIQKISIENYKEFVLPLFIKLREMDYTYMDLTS